MLTIFYYINQSINNDRRLITRVYKSGSFGAAPTAILRKAEDFRRECEERPCKFLVYDYPCYLDGSRATLAKFLNVPVATVVLVANATTGINTVLRNLTWNQDGKDEIIQFNIIYGACGNTTDYICEYNNGVVRTREIPLVYPVEDVDVLAAFSSAIQVSRAEGKRPRLAIFDTVASTPGVRLPFEELAAICRDEKVLSVVDAAHGIGHVKLNLATFDPDFLVSNCHKWLFVPRGCAVFYVPLRNQGLMRSTLPTSHGFVSLSEKNGNPPNSGDGSEFEHNFSFAATDDHSGYLVIPEAIKWREQVCGGEENIRAYCRDLARDGGKRVAEMLGTYILDNKSHTLTDCCMVNISLPLHNSLNDGTGGTQRKVLSWIQRTVLAEHDSYLQLFFFEKNFWVRLSGQVYLDISDFEWAGEVLKKICERAEREALPSYYEKRKSCQPN